MRGEPAPHPVLARLGHGAAQLGGAEDLVAPELHGVDLGLAAFLDIEHQAGHAAGHGLQRDVHHGVAEALLTGLIHDHVLDLAGGLGVVDRVRVDGELLLFDLVLDVGEAHLSAAAEVHLLDEGPFLEADDQLLAAGDGLQLQLDVIEAAAVPEALHHRIEVDVANVVPDLQAGLEDHRLGGLLLRAQHFDGHDGLDVLSPQRHGVASHQGQTQHTSLPPGQDPVPNHVLLRHSGAPTSRVSWPEATSPESDRVGTSFSSTRSKFTRPEGTVSCPTMSSARGSSTCFWMALRRGRAP